MNSNVLKLLVVSGLLVAMIACTFIGWYGDSLGAWYATPFFITACAAGILSIIAILALALPVR